MNETVSRKFNSISFSIICIVCALVPFIFLPGNISGIGAVKGVILYVGVLFAATLWLVSQFLEGKIYIPKSRALAGIAIWVGLVLVSALGSKNVAVSLWGRGFTLDSFATMFVLGLLSFLIAIYTQEQKRLVQLFLAIFSSAVATVVIQILLFLTHSTHFVSTYFSDVATSGTIVGTWIDFAHFVTLTFLLSLLMFEVLSPRGFFKSLSLGSVIVCLIALIFLNFSVAWIITIIVALLVFVYKSSVERTFIHTTEETSQSSRFPLLSFVTLLVALFFFLSSASIGASLSHRAGVSFNDIRPSLSTSVHIARASMLHDPLFGAGPGRYSSAWDMYHRSDINPTIFWNTSFDNGFDTLVSMLVSYGLIPTIAFFFVLVLVIVYGFRLFAYPFPDQFSRFIAVSALIASIALVALLLISVPGLVLVTYIFIYLGLLIGVSTMIGKTKVVEIKYLTDPRLSFFAILLIVVAILAGFTSVYFSGSRFASVIFFNRALSATSYDAANNRLLHATALSQNDLYYRTAAALYTTQFSQLANTQSPDKTTLQNFFSNGESAARAAVSWDPTSATNWYSLGQVYQLALGGTSQDAYTNAVQAVTQAQALSPVNPLFELTLAQFSLANKDEPGALVHIQNAIDLKQNYLDAYVLKAQIRSSHQDIPGARDIILAYTQIAPYDDQGYALLGQSYQSLKDYPNALDAYAKARAIAPTNPNYDALYIETVIQSGDKVTAQNYIDQFAKDFPAQIQLLAALKQELTSGTSAPAITTPTTTPAATTPPKAPVVKKK